MNAIASIASNVAVPFLRQFTYVLMYSSNLSDLETQIQKLQRGEKEVRHTVEAAKRNGEEIEDTVRDWFSRVHAAIEEAQSFLHEDDLARVGCLDVYSKYTMSQRAKNLVDLLSAIRKETFDRVSYRCALKCNFSPGARGYEALESRTAMLDEIMLVLKSDASVHMVGVYGMAGVGKTALVKELAWQAEKDGSFDLVVMATVTNSPNVTTIRAEIADGLGLKFDELTELGRASRLRQRIRQEQKILVILDDVWGKLDLTEVGVPFGEDHEGCKVLVTSRDLNVLTTNLGAKKVYRLEVLSEDESWSLFEKRGGDAVKDLNIQPVAMKISKSCAGLPLLIVTMVEELKNKDLYAWKDSLEQITSVELDGCFYSQLYSAIEQSYNYLESQELKTFFLLLGSLGNNYSTKDLLVFGWCLGLHKRVDSLADGRNRLHKLIDDLRAASLLLEGQRCQIQRRIAELKENECQAAVEDIMYLLIVNKFSEIGVNLVPKLSSCIYNSRLELPSKDWQLESIHSLEVLDMIRAHVASVTGLRAKHSVNESWALTEVRHFLLARIFVASILYGYFLKSVSLRYRLERNLSLSNSGHDPGPRFPLTLDDMCPYGFKDAIFSHLSNMQSIGQGLMWQEEKVEDLKCYVSSFQPAGSLQSCARLRSKEAVNLIKSYSCAVFNSENDEVILTSFSSMKRLVLEAVAFGSFLWETEDYIDNVYMLKDQ